MRGKAVIFFVLAGLWSCDNDSGVEPAFGTGHDFFPLDPELVRIYQVEEISFFPSLDTAQFQLRMQVVDSFQNQAGGFTYIQHLSTRSTASDHWQFLTAWSARLEENRAIQTEENVSFVKLFFPIEENREWDGNAFNVSDGDTYQMIDLFSSYVTPKQDTIPNTLTVLQEDNQDFIVSLDQRKEIYAQDIGLVFKEVVLLNYCTNPNCIGQQIVESGRKLTQYLLEYEDN